MNVGTGYTATSGLMVMLLLRAGDRIAFILNTVRMLLQRADQGATLTVSKLGAGLDVDRGRLDVGILLIIRILAPEDNGDPLAVLSAFQTAL